MEENETNFENETSNEDNASHQQSLVKDSFSTIERLEEEMSSIENEFKSLDDQE